MSRINADKLLIKTHKVKFENLINPAELKFAIMKTITIKEGLYVDYNPTAKMFMYTKNGFKEILEYNIINRNSDVITTFKVHIRYSVNKKWKMKITINEPFICEV